MLLCVYELIFFLTFKNKYTNPISEELKVKKVLIGLLIIALIFAIVFPSSCTASETQSNQGYYVKDYGDGLYWIYSYNTDIVKRANILGEAISITIDENPEMTLSSIVTFERAGHTIGCFLYFTKKTDVVNN